MRKATTQQQHDANESNVDVHDARLELRGAKSLERDLRSLVKDGEINRRD